MMLKLCCGGRMRAPPLCSAHHIQAQRSLASSAVRDLQQISTWTMQAMERELCTQLTTLAVLLLSEADGTADQTQPKQVTTKSKGKKRAAETGEHPLTSAESLW